MLIMLIIVVMPGADIETQSSLMKIAIHQHITSKGYSRGRTRPIELRFKRKEALVRFRMARTFPIIQVI